MKKPDLVHKFEVGKTIGEVDGTYYDIDLLDIISKHKEIDRIGNSTTKYIFDFKRDF